MILAVSCLSESVSGENVCPDSPDWVTRPLTDLPNTGLDVVWLAATALLLVCVGLFILGARRGR